MWLLLFLFSITPGNITTVRNAVSTRYTWTLFLTSKKTSPQQGKRMSSNFSSSDHLAYFKTRKGDSVESLGPILLKHECTLPDIQSSCHSCTPWRLSLLAGEHPALCTSPGNIRSAKTRSFMAIQKCFRQIHWKLYALFSPKQHRSLCGSKLYSDLGGALHSWFYRREEELLVYA